MYATTTKRIKKKQGASRNAGAQIVVVRGGTWAPARIATTLRFSDFVTLSAGASTAANVRFAPTFAYDVDPTVGSTAMAGFSEYASMYRFYRVTGSKAKCAFANAQAFNVAIYLIPENVDPGANYSSSVAQQQLANPYCKSSVIGPLTGKGVATLTHSMTTAQYAGAWDHNVFDSYCGSTAGTTPSNNWFWVVGVVGTATVSTGINVLVTLDIDIEFFELANPAT